MLSFRLATLSSLRTTPEILAAWELFAYFAEEAHPKDLPIDEDEAREWYIEQEVEEGSKADYRAEPHLAETEMVESFTAALGKLAEDRSKELGNNYPLSLSEDRLLSRRNDAPLSVVGASYLCLQFYRALISGTIEIDNPGGGEIKSYREAFDKNFRNLFEYIAGYAVAGETSGASFMTSHCRSSARLEGLLNSICRKVGAGTVIPYGQWNLQQRNANDGGVDCLIHAGGPGMPGNAYLALVGATVQKTAIEQKIMGPEKIDFFRSFFLTQPAAFRGILVRPLDEDELTRIKCNSKDCLLYSYEQIWRNMGKEPTNAYQDKFLKRLDAKARRLLSNFEGTKLLGDYDEYDLPAA